MMMFPLPILTASEKLRTILLLTATAGALSGGDELLNVGAVSSSVIVKIDEWSEKLELEAFERLMMIVSLFSSNESERMGIDKEPDVFPAAIVIVPLVAV